MKTRKKKSALRVQVAAEKTARKHAALCLVPVTGASRRSGISYIKAGREGRVPTYRA